MRGISAGWLCHPVTVGALLLLLVNDHLLKAAHPGWVTGKLSDAAGLVLAPALLAALAGLIAPRRRFARVKPVAIGTVGVLFATIKISPYAAELASSAWSLVTPSLVRADPADLLALPFLGIAWWTAGRAASDQPGDAGAAGRAPSGQLRGAAVAGRAAADRLTDAGAAGRGRRRPISITVLVLPLAVFAVAATSAAPELSADRAGVVDGSLYLGYDDLDYSSSWARSSDGGLTWVSTPPPVTPVIHRTEACARSAPVVCYRSAPPGLAVESRTGDGPWVDSWRISEREQAALADAYDGSFGSGAIAVQDLPAGGHVVLVANGRDGFALRDAAGAWTRIGYPGRAAGSAPPEIPREASRRAAPDEVRFALAVLTLITGLALTVAGAASLARRGGSRHWWWLLAPQVAAAPALLTLTSAGAATSVPAALTPFVLAGLALAGALPALIVAGTRVARPERWVRWIGLIPVLSLWGGWMAFELWARSGATGFAGLAAVLSSAAVLSALGAAGAVRTAT